MDHTPLGGYSDRQVGWPQKREAGDRQGLGLLSPAAGRWTLEASRLILLDRISIKGRSHVARANWPSASALPGGGQHGPIVILRGSERAPAGTAIGGPLADGALD